MIRHAAFQDLSRDYFSALLACMHIKRASEGHEFAPPPLEAVSKFKSLWEEELGHHFDEEDSNLDGLLEEKGADELVDRLRSDHAEIRGIMQTPPADEQIDAWAEIAELLRLHVRWEEDELFPWMQDHLSDDELRSLLDASVDFRTKARGPASVQAPSAVGTSGQGNA